jgi:hypothetical protein
MRQLYLVSADFADRNFGFFPRVEQHEFAAIFASKLVGQNYISAENLAPFLICPADENADELRSTIQIPTFAALVAMTPAELAFAKRKLASSYAYRLGYFEGSDYRCVRNDRNSGALFSDAPGDEKDGVSRNHDGHVVQVLNCDGSVSVLTSCKKPGIEDDLFHNALGVVAAGIGRHDSVLGDSMATPGNHPGVMGR